MNRDNARLLRLDTRMSNVYVIQYDDGEIERKPTSEFREMLRNGLSVPGVSIDQKTNKIIVQQPTSAEAFDFFGNKLSEGDTVIVAFSDFISDAYDKRRAKMDTNMAYGVIRSIEPDNRLTVYIDQLTGRSYEWQCYENAYKAHERHMTVEAEMTIRMGSMMPVAG